MFRTGRYIILTCMLFAVPTCEREKGPVPSRLPSPVRAQFPLTNGFPVVVPMKFGDVEYRFIFDTGCSITSFNEKHKNLLGAYVKSYTSTGALLQTTPVDAFAIPDEAMMQLGPIRIKGQVGAMDYTVLGAWLNEYDGLLGIDVIGQFIIQLDFEKQQLRFLDPNTPSIPDWGTPFDIQFFGGTPHLDVRLSPSISETFMIDTAAPLIYLAQEKFESLVREYDSNSSYTQRPITLETKDLAGALVKDLHLGPLAYDRLQIVEYPRSFLGMDFLRKHTMVTLDCARRKLYLKKPTPEPPSPSDLSCQRQPQIDTN